MNTKELAEQLIKWLPELAAGKTLMNCGLVKGSKICVKIIDVKMLIRYLEDGLGIEIQQTPIPDPPDGEEWQNPHSLTAEQIGIDYGWRLLLTSELNPLRDNKPCEIWVSFRGESHWVNLGVGGDERITYRVKADKYPVGSLKPKATAFEYIMKPGDRVEMDGKLGKLLNVDDIGLRVLWADGDEEYYGDSELANMIYVDRIKGDFNKLSDSFPSGDKWCMPAISAIIETCKHSADMGMGSIGIPDIIYVINQVIQGENAD